MQREVSTMSATFVRNIVREYIESNRPSNLNMWPAIRDEAQKDALENKAGPLNVPGTTVQWRSNVNVPPRVAQPAATLGKNRFRISVVMAWGALLALAAITLVFVTGSRFQRASPQAAKNAFLPTGKVRHMIYTGTYTVADNVQTNESHHDEFWLTEGGSHTLMRSIVTVPISAMTWLDDNAYYEYEPAKGNMVHKYPYDPKYLAGALPDPEIVTKTLQIPNARLVGDDTLSGRPVVVIMVSSTNSNEPSVPAQTPVAREASFHTGTTGKYWIDRENNQLLQFSTVVTLIGGPQDGLVKEESVNKIALNELIDRSALPADFFEFKLPPGATLVQGEFPFSVPTP
jgi:hypothetical protein